MHNQTKLSRVPLPSLHGESLEITIEVPFSHDGTHYIMNLGLYTSGILKVQKDRSSTLKC